MDRHHNTVATTQYIEYRSGYNYQLASDYLIRIPIYGVRVDERYFELSSVGRLIIRQGYAWDGASGPVVDTRSVMRASLVHDVLYQMMREGLVDEDEEREIIDRLYEELVTEDVEKMYSHFQQPLRSLLVTVGKARAWCHFVGLRWFGHRAATGAGTHRLYTSP